MLNYKKHTAPLGYSDIASLLVRTPYGVDVLKLGADGHYTAYIADDSTLIPSHYSPALILGGGWLWIYDDNGRTFRHDGADAYTIHQAGDMGVIIQIHKGEG